MTIFNIAGSGSGGSGGLTFKEMTTGLYEIKASDWGNGYTTIPYYYFAYDTFLKKLELPNGVTSIQNDMCTGCTALEEVFLPDSITSMQANTFNACQNLIKANLPNNITLVPGSTFNNCHYLKEMIIPDSVTTIGTTAFYRCRRLEKLTIGSGVTSIGASAFNGIGSYLSTGTGTIITILATSPPTLPANAFTSALIQKIIVPQGTLTAYQTATNWSAYAQYMEEAA